MAIQAGGRGFGNNQLTVPRKNMAFVGDCPPNSLPLWQIRRKKLCWTCVTISGSGLIHCLITLQNLSLLLEHCSTIFECFGGGATRNTSVLQTGVEGAQQDTTEERGEGAGPSRPHPTSTTEEGGWAL